MSLLTPEIVSQLAQDIWAALLCEDGILEVRPEEPPGRVLVATTEISGQWNGTVCLSCSRTAALHATATMFGTEEDELTEADIVDALGELVNVVGGSMKSLVPGPSVLSLPTVRPGDQSWVSRLGQLELLQEVYFSWMAEPVVLSVWSAPDGP